MLTVHDMYIVLRTLNINGYIVLCIMYYIFDCIYILVEFKMVAMALAPQAHACSLL